MEARKRCKGCDKDSPLSGFYANAKGRFGRHTLCKACMHHKKQRSLNKFRSLGDVRVPPSKVCAMCRQDIPAAGFSRYATSGDGLRTYCIQCDRIVRRSGKYGLTRSRVSEMLTQPNCEACGRSFQRDADKHIDHRHSDGAVRGVLCERCNTTLGKCEENPEVLMGICRYITRTINVDYRKQPYLEQILPHMDSSSAGPLTPEEPARTCPTNTTLQPTSPHP